MASVMKSVLFVSIIIIMLLKGESQLLQNISFLENDLMKFFFPKNPNLMKVRKLEEVKESMSDATVLDFIGLVEQYGYSAEEHNITTEDGYNLVIHRISGSPLWNSKEKKKVVFIQHGIFASSDIWVLFGPGRDLAFLLADQGYDIWIGNYRGNTYCRSHKEMTIYDHKYWQFTFHEMGAIDLPTMLDYVLNYTQEENLNYIGHSMGTTTLFVLLSTKPEYNAKIKVAICLAPVAFWIKISPIFYDIINLIPIVKEFLESYEIYDIFPQSLATVTVGKMLCNDKTMTQIICIAIFFLIAGSDPSQLNTTALPYVMSYFPAGASLKTLHHYYQNINTNNFRNYDYGIVDNYKRYNQETPPNYNLDKITAPIALFYSSNDVIATKQNAFELSNHLANVLIEEVPYKLFSHADFTWAINAKTFLYDRVLEILEKFNVT